MAGVVRALLCVMALAAVALASCSSSNHEFSPCSGMPDTCACAPGYECQGQCATANCDGITFLSPISTLSKCACTCCTVASCDTAVSQSFLALTKTAADMKRGSISVANLPPPNPTATTFGAFGKDFSCTADGCSTTSNVDLSSISCCTDGTCAFYDTAGNTYTASQVTGVVTGHLDAMFLCTDYEGIGLESNGVAYSYAYYGSRAGRVDSNTCLKQALVDYLLYQSSCVSTPTPVLDMALGNAVAAKCPAPPSPSPPPPPSPSPSPPSPPPPPSPTTTQDPARSTVAPRSTATLKRVSITPKDIIPSGCSDHCSQELSFEQDGNLLRFQGHSHNSCECYLFSLSRTFSSGHVYDLQGVTVTFSTNGDEITAHANMGVYSATAVYKVVEGTLFGASSSGGGGSGGGGGGGGMNMIVVIGAAVGGLAVLVGVAVGVFFLVRRHRRKTATYTAMHVNNDDNDDNDDY